MAGKTEGAWSYYTGRWLGGGGEGDGQRRDAERDGEIASSSSGWSSRGPCSKGSQVDWSSMLDG